MITFQGKGGGGGLKTCFLIMSWSTEEGIVVDRYKVA